MRHGLFSVRLRELREEQGYSSQQAFASAFGVAQSTVGNWEAGRREPNQETTIRLAAFFGVTTDYLLGLVNDPFFYLDNVRILEEINEQPGDGLPWLRVVRGAEHLSKEGIEKLADYAEDLVASNRYKKNVGGREVSNNGIHTQEDHEDG